MPYRSVLGGSRGGRGQHRQSGLLRVCAQSGDRTQRRGIPPPEIGASASSASGYLDRGCDAASSVQQAILQAVRARGGRLWMDDIVFEVRCRGMRPELIDAVVGDLVARGLLRGPLSHSMVYELTAAGWDVCAVAIGRA